LKRQRPTLLLLTTILIVSFSSPSVDAQTLPDDWDWTYYRPTNTGIQGDNSDALWIDADGDPYIAAYNPFWEEGGFARFIQSEKRWENVSNVDYPLIGDPEDLGAARIREILPDGEGRLWLITWGALLSYRPDIGPTSLKRFDSINSPMPNGFMRDIDRAPDGSLWICCDGGGLVRYEPTAGTWTVWGAGADPDGWPGWAGVDRVNVQELPGGNYLVWVEDEFWGRVVYDSATQLFSSVPNNDQPGEVARMIRNAVDETGNVWMFREQAGSLGWDLDFIRPDGSWGTPHHPYSAFYGMGAFQAFGDGQALMVAGTADVWHFNGSNWSNLGAWPAGNDLVGGLGMDALGNIWVSGIGGSARRDAQTGQWQRYRITNTAQIDMWVRDISFGANGEVWTTGNTAPGVGGIAVFDGLRWYNYNIYTYGLGGSWPYPCDNADAICYRPSTGRTAFNPTNNGIREVDGDSFFTLEDLSKSDGLAEDSLGRLWTMGNYYDLRYHDAVGFVDVPIDGWGVNVVPDPDRPGTVWACANFEVLRTDGDYRYARETTELPELNPMHDTLVGVVAGPGGIGWLGTTEGIFRLDAEAGTHQWWHSSNSAMPGDQMQPLAVAPDGRVWFTNFNSDGIEASLVWFDGVDFGTVTRADGLPHAQIYDAELRVVDDAYELWLACASRGIAVLTVPLEDLTGVAESTSELRILTGSPNPFTDRSVIDFSLETAGLTSLEVFDVRGRRVRTLASGPRPAGAQRVTWNGRDEANQKLASGVYFVRLRAEGQEAHGRIVLLR
jgi:hypothetical protein